MKKSALALACACSALLSPSSSFAGEEKDKGIYLNLGAGLGQTFESKIDETEGGGTITFDGSAFSGDIGIGYDFGNFRTELGYNSASNEVKTIQGDTTTQKFEYSTIQFTAFYDLRAGKRWQPYIGVGVGSTEVSTTTDHTGTTGLEHRGTTTINSAKGDKTVTSTSLKVGVNFRASDSVDVYTELWGQSYGDFAIANQSYKRMAATGATLGARIKF